ncbi:MAG: hypothetical protein PHI52_09780 [Bacteroidales bacterium]|jgi:hypothetical protein|nr:hypothetical protein [Bacteroidales bacterium]
MDQELNNKIDSLISKFENGQERYQKSAMFVLEVGTDNTEDYYPYCVMNYF